MAGECPYPAARSRGNAAALRRVDKDAAGSGRGTQWERMVNKSKSSNLNGILDNLSDAGEQGERVAVAEVMETVGQRSFGPLLLVPGLIVLSPIAGIPGVGSAAGVVVLLIAGQLLIGCDSFWLPKFIRKRTVERRRIEKSVKTLRPVARVVDKVLRPRLDFLTRRPFTYVVAATCVGLGLHAARARHGAVHFAGAGGGDHRFRPCDHRP